MRVSCQQETLAPALRTLSKMAKPERFPLYQSVLLTATCSDERPEQGTLTLLGMGMGGMVGMMTQVPATVERSGQALLPIEPLAEYVAGLRPGTLTLSQQRQDQSVAQLPQVSAGEGPTLPTVAVADLLRSASMTFPFQIESAYLSASAMVSTNLATLAAWEEWSHYPHPPIQHWLTASMPVTVLQAAAFKEAIACCAPFANQGSRGKEEAAEMYGMLLRIDADAVSFTATNATTLIAHHRHLEQAPSFSFAGLFSGKALSWIKEGLAHGEVTLALSWEAGARKPVLLIRSEHMTWFCRSMDAPFPRTWTSLLPCSHEAELWVRRNDLTPPLTFYAGSVAHSSEALSLLVEGNTLWLCPFALKEDTVQGQREVPLLHASGPLSLLLDPQQFKQLVRCVQGEVLHLQFGHFVRDEEQERKRIGFVRITSEHTTVMMSLSRSESGALSPSSDAKGAVEASAKTTEPVLVVQGA